MRILTIAFSIFSLLSLQSHSMTFDVDPDFNGQGLAVVIGQGPLEKGDAARFNAAVNDHPDASILQISSLGGNVPAAMELAEQIRIRGFSVVGHGECASACAQIVFPAGEYSILTPGSVLGIHSCSASGTADSLCNEEIARLAVSNGFPYGTLSFFSDLYGPGQMKWMTEISARCFGYYRDTEDPKPNAGGKKACVDGAIFTLGSRVQPRPFGPSFDCRKAISQIEQLLCLDKELMQVDSILGRVYDVALSNRSARNRAILRAEQRSWIKRRNADCRRFFSASMDLIDTRRPALCIFKYNERRIYDLIN